MIHQNHFRFDAVVYAAGHFLVDFSCALTMLSMSGTNGWHFIAYNFLAFAVQMPIGLLADIFGRNRRFALLGIILVLAGLCPGPRWLRVLCAGLGNACYHVGGGRDALLHSKGLTGLGIFVSPGAIGIFLGTLLAGNIAVQWIAAALLAAWGLLITWGCSPDQIILPKRKPRITAASLMLLVVILRSLVGMCAETPWKLSIYVVLSAIAGACGKALGGILGDRFGARRTGIVSLVLAAVLFCFPDTGIAGVMGVLLFNMTMPITLGRAAKACPGYEGFSFGLLTLGLFLGYLPSAYGLSLSPFVGAGLSLISAVLLLLDREGNHD